MNKHYVSGKSHCYDSSGLVRKYVRTFSVAYRCYDHISLHEMPAFELVEDASSHNG
jgi:hypothetical protein